MNEWLENLKVGDTVIVSGGDLNSRDYVSTVVRFTKTLIIVNNQRIGVKFRRDGRSRGGGFHPLWLQQPTQEALDEIMQTTLAIRCSRHDWKSLPLETLREVAGLLCNASAKKELEEARLESKRRIKVPKKT